MGVGCWIGNGFHFGKSRGGKDPGGFGIRGHFGSGVCREERSGLPHAERPVRFEGKTEKREKKHGNIPGRHLPASQPASQPGRNGGNRGQPRRPKRGITELAGRKKIGRNFRRRSGVLRSAGVPWSFRGWIRPSATVRGRRTEWNGGVGMWVRRKRNRDPCCERERWWSIFRENRGCRGEERGERGRKGAENEALVSGKTQVAQSG